MSPHNEAKTLFSDPFSGYAFVLGAASCSTNLYGSSDCLLIDSGDVDVTNQQRCL